MMKNGGMDQTIQPYQKKGWGGHPAMQAVAEIK